jgi:hypothetical protein
MRHAMVMEFLAVIIVLLFFLMVAVFLSLSIRRNRIKKGQKEAFEQSVKEPLIRRNFSGFFSKESEREFPVEE